MDNIVSLQPISSLQAPSPNTPGQHSLGYLKMPRLYYYPLICGYIAKAEPSTFARLEYHSAIQIRNPVPVVLQFEDALRKPSGSYLSVSKIGTLTSPLRLGRIRTRYLVQLVWTISITIVRTPRKPSF